MRIRQTLVVLTSIFDLQNKRRPSEPPPFGGAC
jgi:hypothetical protein